MRNCSQPGRLVPLSALLFCLAATPAIAGSGEELFERTIRPYLVERCYSCHATHGTRENGLAVDWAGGLAEAASTVRRSCRATPTPARSCSR
jgi:hypothetical protein